MGRLALFVEASCFLRSPQEPPPLAPPPRCSLHPRGRPPPQWGARGVRGPPNAQASARLGPDGTVCPRPPRTPSSGRRPPQQQTPTPAALRSWRRSGGCHCVMRTEPGGAAVFSPNGRAACAGQARGGKRFCLPPPIQVHVPCRETVVGARGDGGKNRGTHRFHPCVAPFIDKLARRLLPWARLAADWTMRVPLQAPQPLHHMVLGWVALAPIQVCGGTYHQAACAAPRRLVRARPGRAIRMKPPEGWVARVRGRR